MKTVFNNQMCAHVWAQLKQPHGRSGSMRFDGAVLYSYREPIAHIVETANHHRVALFTSRKWSVTTSSHVSDARSAFNGDSFTVPDLLLGRFHLDASTNHTANVLHFVAQYRAEAERLLKVAAESWQLSSNENDGLPEDRMRYPTRAHALLADLFAQQIRYCEVFGYTVQECDWKADADKAIERRDRLLNDPKRQAKREAGRIAREKAKEKRLERAMEQRRMNTLEAAERVQAWLAGQGASLHYGDVQGPYALLRVSGDKVQSSMGAECPLADAMIAIRFVRVIMMRGGEVWRRNGEHIRLGEFEIDLIDTDGNVRAGCHRIQFSEIDRIGKAIGV